MDSFKNIKPNPYPLKTKYGYGCIDVSRKKHHKVSKRNALRSIRNIGFDYSETWGLDYTMSAWLSDYVGGFFRQCGQIDSWASYNLEGTPLNLAKNTKECIEAESARIEEFKAQLSNFLKTDSLLRDKFIWFVYPRLEFLAEHSNGYPPHFDNYEAWKKCIKKMGQDLKYDKYSQDFIEHFFCLWD